MRTKPLLLTAVATILWISSTWATEITIPPLTVKSGRTIEIPIMIDEVDNLAGVKLVMTYDPEVLTYRKGAKTKETDSLMHIVNDRKPGALIIVMAGARGIRGKDFSIFTLTFDVKKEVQENLKTNISITESQLMGDDLKELKVTITSHPIAILP